MSGFLRVLPCELIINGNKSDIEILMLAMYNSMPKDEQVKHKFVKELGKMGLNQIISVLTPLSRLIDTEK